MIIVNDLCFDISRINSSAYRVSDFVDSLIFQDEGESRYVHQYEQTLKYVEFPPLDMMVADREAYRENSYLTRCHDEVFRILKWLESKGVEKIIKLKVPDRLVNPHDDVEMAKWVARFKVEVLDWRVLDLSISVFENKTHEDETQEIEELRLYSSGKRSVINHWFNKGGLDSLGKVSCEPENACMDGQIPSRRSRFRQSSQNSDQFTYANDRPYFMCNIAEEALRQRH